MKNLINSIWPIGLSIFLLAGCSSGSSSKGDPVSIDNKIEIKESSLERNFNPTVETNQTNILVKNNNTFAFNMFKELQKDENENIFFSPYSISQALVMTYAGAKDNTKTQMASALHFDENDSKLHNTFNALDLHLNHSDENYTLSVANAIWPQKDFRFLESYLDTIKVNYGAKVRLMDYVNNTENSRKIINDWVEEKTHDRIKDLIPEGSISADTRLVLTNAIYFKGKWQKEFDKELTKDETFTLEDNSTIQTPLMHQIESFLYVENVNFQAIELPYKQDKSSMLVILPAKGKFQEVLTDINSTFDIASTNLKYKRINLKMPKFEFTTGLYDLSKHFVELGMSDAFDGNLADFSNMSGQKDLVISKILHKAFIKVDEKETEAAAATGVIANGTSIPILEEPIDLFVDRPFILFIKDQMTNQILFIGIIKKPKS